jgi:hypothetical protein
MPWGAVRRAAREVLVGKQVPWVPLGPIIIFDKSALQGLSIDQAVWFDHFYYANITPLFFVETLADLEKEVAAGRTPEQVVGNLALKAPIRGGMPNVHHHTLAIGDLLGYHLEMRRFPSSLVVAKSGHKISVA